MMARSSQVRSTERRLGVSMAEVVMDDMAIGNPVSPCGPALALWASFPGIHIAQFPFQVIGNCGVISLMHCSNRQRVKVFGKPESHAERIKVWVISLGGGRWAWGELRPELPVGHVEKMTVSWRWRRCGRPSAAQGEFDDGCAVDRGNWLFVGWCPDDRFRDPGQGIQFRQYLDPHRHGRGLHRHDHARPLDGRSRIEEYCAAAWPGGCDRRPGSPIQP